MSYRDIYEYLADRRCVKCDKPLDRNGSFCLACMAVLQDELEQAEAKEVRTAMIRKPVPTIESKDDRRYSTLETWEFLNDQFQRMFRK